VAAEYEVNIKLNTQEIKTQLNEIDRVLKDIGKGGRGGGSKSGVGAGIAKQLSLFTADSIFGRGRITGTALKNVKLSWLGAFDEIQDVANTIGGRRSARLLNVKTSWGKAFEGLAKNAKVLELGGLNTQTSWGKALTGLQDNAKVLKLSGVNTQTSWGKALTGLQDNAKVLKLSGVNTQTGWTKALTGLQDNAKVLKLSGVNTQTSWGKALTGLQDNAKVLRLGGVNTQTSWTKALTGLQDNAKVLDIQNLNVRTSWGKALEQLGETAEIIAKNAATARAQFLAGAPISGLAPGQTAGPARPPVQGVAFPIGGTAGIPGSPEFQRALEIGRFNSSPIQGAANIPGSPEAKRIRKQRLEQVGLGAGFPLLFGGGAGSVLGGGLGGLTGSFGAQIAFSAIGQQIDQFVAGMVDAGKALTSVGGAADFMAEKSLFSSDSMQFRIEKLIEEGQVTEAAALMTQEMAKQVGGSGLKALKDLGTEASKMGKIFGTLLLRVQAFIAQALTPLIKIINRAIGGLTAQSQLDQMIAEAGSPERGAEILARSRELRGVKISARTGKAMGLNALTPEIIQTLQEEYPALIPKGAAIEPTNLEVLRAADSGGGRAARDEERLQKRLGRLAEERKKVLEISRFRDKIAAAEAAQDDELVIRLQGEQRIAEIEASRLKALVGVADQRERDAINIGKATEKLAAHRTTERELGELQRQRQEKFEDTIENLEHQLKLARATSEEERERLRIEKELQELREGGMSESQLGQVGNLMRQISAENSPLNQFIKQSVESLNNLEQHAVQVSQGIGNAIGNSLVSGLQNLITGAESVKEVFANMLKSIADVLAQQAAQMIGTYIAIGIARAFAGMGSGESATLQTGPGQGLTSSITDVNPGVLGSLGYAEGGYVSGPTRALVGEGGESEYIIPESKMRESMTRYSRGARGSSVIPDSGASGTSGEGGGVAVAAPIDVRYTVERINSVDYVTADQFQRGLQSAADQGAKKGEQQTLKRLQLSGSTRKRIGL